MPTGPIGFIGLGKMGAPMSERLVRAGFTLHVYDIDVPAVRRLSELGDVAPKESPRALAESVATLVLMLPSSAVVEQVLIDDGALAGLAQGSIVIDMGSSEPARTKKLAVDASTGGVVVVDAPVSGGVSAAVAGTLTIMVGGPPEALASVRPLFDVLGSRVVRVGDAGAGHAVKALNNLMSAVHLLASSEALRAAEAFGLDVERVLDVVNTSSGRSGSTENKWPNFVLPETYDSGFSLDLMVKDMAIAVGLAGAVGIEATLSLRALEMWRAAAAELEPGADHTEIARWITRTWR